MYGLYRPKQFDKKVARSIDIRPKKPVYLLAMRRQIYKSDEADAKQLSIADVSA